MQMKKNNHIKVEHHGLKKLCLFKKMSPIGRGEGRFLSHQKSLLIFRVHQVLVNSDLKRKNNLIMILIYRKKKNMKLKK